MWGGMEKLHHGASREGHVRLAAQRQAEWESSGSGWRIESLDPGPLQTQVLWLLSEPLQVFLHYHSNKK